MSLLDRVKTRIETDLADAELTAMIDEIGADIDARYGALGAITVSLGHARDIAADRRFLMLTRPADEAQTITVVEIDPPNTGAAANRTTLAADDFRVLDRGRTLERLIDGTNGASFWAPLVEVTYTPLTDTRSRDEITIKLVQLDLTYRGLDKSESAGDYSRAGPPAADAYTAEREALLAQLAPSRGLQLA